MIQLKKLSLLLAQKTLKLRHGIVKLLAPNLYLDETEILRLIVAEPRPMTLFMKDWFKGRKLLGAEIGVCYGINTVSLLEELQIRKLFLIDPYMQYVENSHKLSYEDAFQTTKDKLAGYSQIQWIKKISAEAIREVDEPLDFVYIDGNHSYEHVKEDIELYYPLVKSGGVIGGHDYTSLYHVGVFQAVNQFVEKHGRLGFYAVLPDWWIVKGGV